MRVRVVEDVVAAIQAEARLCLARKEAEARTKKKKRKERKVAFTSHTVSLFVFQRAILE